jgi:MoaA/NifB/PqqE/SkfB family radical SAM enzyme
MSYFTTTQKLRLFRSLASKRSPAYVQFYLTSRRDRACEQCNIIYGDADADEMDIEQIRAVAQNLAKIGTATVLLIGGEPFVRRDLPEIVKAFIAAGIHVRLQTNGLASRERLEACVEAGAHDISISLDSLEGALQDTINGGAPGSWERAMQTVAVVNEIFPENGTAFFGTVLMQRNLTHIPDVIEFATAIGWGVSLVPVHVTSPDTPRGFRAFDDDGICQIPAEDLPIVRRVIDRVKELKRQGRNVYDSDVYLEDIYRFIAGEPTKWRDRNGGVCDSPRLYFAIAPNGNLKPCCDFRLPKTVPVYSEDFPAMYRDGSVESLALPITSACEGCMYGSYPEVTISSRFLRPALERIMFFSKRPTRLKPLSYERMREIAVEISRSRDIVVGVSEDNEVG